MVPCTEHFFLTMVSFGVNRPPRKAVLLPLEPDYSILNSGTTKAFYKKTYLKRGPTPSPSRCPLGLRHNVVGTIVRPLMLVFVARHTVTWNLFYHYSLSLDVQSAQPNYFVNKSKKILQLKISQFNLLTYVMVNQSRHN